MKILMLGWELPPHNSGGLGVACYQMCKHLAIKGVEIEFLLPYRPPRSVREAASFMKIHHSAPLPAKEFINLHGIYDSYCYTCDQSGCPHASPEMRGQQQRFTRYAGFLAASSDFDAIHAHEWLTFEAGIHAKQLSGKPLIAHVHATEFDRSGEHGGNPLVHEIEYNGLMMADRIVAVSQFTKDLIVREYNIPADKIEVVHNSLDAYSLEGYSPDNAYRYLTEMKARGYRVVVSLARLTTQKGLQYLLRAAQAVVQQNPKVLFVLAGDGELRDELLQLSADLGIAHNVIFTGFVRGKPWRDAYAAADIFVLSSVSEPFGLTALEAAFYQNAILLTKQSGVGEVLHHAIRYDFWDTRKLADGILNIASSPAMQETLAQNALRECQNLSWHRAAETCQALYGELAAKGAPA